MKTILRDGLALVFLLAPALLSAQASGTVPTPNRASAVAARPTHLVPTATTLAEADTLLREIGLERVIQVGAMTAFDAAAQQQPMMEQLRDVMATWAAKHLTWVELGAAMTQVYAETFTESELRAFVGFYRTPAGRQLARRTPELSQRGAQIGADVATRYKADLQQMIQARLAEIKAGTKRP